MSSLVRLGDLCELYNGKAFTAADWSASGLPIIRIQNLKDSNRAFNYWAGSAERQVIVDNGDVLLAWSGTPGTSFGAHVWHGPRGVLNQHIFKIVLDERRILKRWCVRAINFQLDRLIAQAHGGVGLKHVTRPMVESLAIPLPPLDEQRWLSAILDQADDLRVKRGLALELLATLPRAIFHEIFGDPIANPYGFARGTLSEICDSTDHIRCGPFGTQLLREEFTSTGVPLWGIRQVNSAFRVNTTEFVSPSKAQELSSYSLLAGDIVMTRKGTVGNCAVYPPHFPPGIMHSDLLRVRVNLDKVNPTFFSEQLRLSGAIHRQITLISGGAIMPGINVGKLKQIEVLIPPKPLQDAFAVRLTAVDTLRRLYEANLSRLGALFASIQYHAFAGSLTVSSVQAALASA